MRSFILTYPWSAEHSAGQLAGVRQSLEQQSPVPHKARAESANGHHNAAAPRLLVDGKLKVALLQDLVRGLAAHVGGHQQS